MTKWTQKKLGCCNFLLQELYMNEGKTCMYRKGKENTSQLANALHERISNVDNIDKTDYYFV